MARIKSIDTKEYIYKIEVDGRTYIGQTEAKSGDRIEQHIRNAYYGSFKDSSEETGELYKRMAQYRLMDLKITYYPAPYFGIQGFDEARKQFSRFWRPVGQRTTRDEKNKENKQLISPIDFAEIFHILKNQYEGARLFNIQMGGKTSGYELVDSNNKQKVLMNNFSPRDGLNIVLTSIEKTQFYAQVTQQVINDLFSSDWKTIQNNYREQMMMSDFINSPSVKQWNASSETWGEFWINQLIPYLQTNLPEWVGGRKNLSGADELEEFIKKNFVKPKEIVGRAILEFKFRQSDYAKKDWETQVLNKTQEDWTQTLGFYIYDTVTNKISRDLKGRWTIDNKISATMKTFKPVNYTVIFKPRRPKKIDTNAASWLLDHNIDSGVPMSDASKKYLSIRLFNYGFHHITTIDFPQPEEVNWYNQPVVKMYKLSSSDWLSNRMRLWYIDHAPAYVNKGWQEFYRTMVACWRITAENGLHRSEPDEVERDDEFSYYVMSDGSLAYTKVLNFVTQATTQDLKIY